ncbi:thioesterase domain-containing protein [Micromonospora aurantiaca]|uniref:thioesterase domain-containing protein n=1 Tax=Micromonospora aurantiaca (nom. illeg.) TaxID=47850 RepID=UPI0033B2B0B1
MSATLALRQVSQGPTDSLLTVEFSGDSAGPGLAAALAAADPDRSVWRFDPVTTLERAGTPLDHPALARACAEELLRRRPGGAPVTVLGYCSAAPLARHVARALADAGATPRRVLLVAAARPTVATARAEYAALLGKLGRAAPVADDPPGDGDPTALAARWGAELTGQARTFVAEQGFPPEESAAAADEIAGRYRAWLWFLLDAAYRADARLPCPHAELADERAALDALAAEPAAGAG